MRSIPITPVKSGREGELLAQGWIKRTTIGAARVPELVDNYRSMGYEVCVIDHPVETSGDSCNTCFSDGPEGAESYGDIYIRPGAQSAPLLDDLF